MAGLSSAGCGGSDYAGWSMFASWLWFSLWVVVGLKEIWYSRRRVGDLAWGVGMVMVSLVARGFSQRVLWDLNGASLRNSLVLHVHQDVVRVSREETSHHRYLYGRLPYST